MMAIWKSFRNFGKLVTLIIVFAWCLSLFSTSFAADEVIGEVGGDEIADTGDTPDYGDDTDDTVESYFSNPAQAAHAANLAEASALSDEEAEALEQEALAELAEAQAALDAGEISADEFAEIEAAIDNRLAGISGVSVAEIGEMRATGMGWGEIAHEICVHPSVLGLGHQKKARNSYTNQEMVEATKRNTKTGYAKGHGVGLDSSDDGFGLASSKGLKSSGKSGIAGASGLSGNKGKSNSSNSKSGSGQSNGNNGNSKGNSGGGKGNNGGGNGNGKK
jgi:hypothetical protein